MNADATYDRFLNAGPVVVGGIGGSGTRVITQILSGLGYYMGGDLNESEDFLGYTLLFKRKRWFLDKRFNKEEIFRGLSVLKKLMITREYLSIPELIFFLSAIKSMALHGHNHLGRQILSCCHISEPRISDSVLYHKAFSRLRNQPIQSFPDSYLFY